MDEYVYSQSVHKDFHSVMSYLIKYLRKNHDTEHLETFFKDASKYIYKPLIERIKKNGLVEMETHLKRTFSNEGGKFDIYCHNNKLLFKVKKCPAIWYMKENKAEIDKDFCRMSTEIVNKAIAEECGYYFSVKYDQENGKCEQKYWKE